MTQTSIDYLSQEVTPTWDSEHLNDVLQGSIINYQVTSKIVPKWMFSKRNERLVCSKKLTTSTAWKFKTIIVADYTQGRLC